MVSEDETKYGVQKRTKILIIYFMLQCFGRPSLKHITMSDEGGTFTGVELWRVPAPSLGGACPAVLRERPPYSGREHLHSLPLRSRLLRPSREGSVSGTGQCSDPVL